jgi:hypothetical protein
LRKTEEERIIYNKTSICYVGLAEKVVCEGREQGTGNSFNCLDILLPVGRHGNFPNLTNKNAIHFETPLAKTLHFFVVKIRETLC